MRKLPVLLGLILGFLVLQRISLAQVNTIPEIKPIFFTSSVIIPGGVVWEDSQFIYYPVFNDTGDTMLVLKYDIQNKILTNIYSTTGLLIEFKSCAILNKTGGSVFFTCAYYNPSAELTEYAIYEFTGSSLIYHGADYSATAGVFYVKSLTNQLEYDGTRYKMLPTAYSSNLIEVYEDGTWFSLSVPTSIIGIFEAWAVYDSLAQKYFVFAIANHQNYPGYYYLYVLRYDSGRNFETIIPLITEFDVSYMRPYVKDSGDYRLVFYDFTNNRYLDYKWETYENGDVALVSMETYYSYFIPKTPHGYKYTTGYGSFDFYAQVNGTGQLLFTLRCSGSGSCGLDLVRAYCLNGTEVEETVGYTIGAGESKRFFFDFGCEFHQIYYSGYMSSSDSQIVSATAYIGFHPQEYLARTKKNIFLFEPDVYNYGNTIFLASQPKPPQPEKYNITSCMDITEPGTYVLQNDLHLTDSLRTSCLHVLSDNVRIDLNNHKIVNDLGKDNVRFGIYSAGWLVKQNYLEISNGTIEGFTTGIIVGDYNQVRIQRITTLGNNKGISAGNIDTLYITDSKIYDEVPIGSLPDGKYDIIGIELNQIYGGIISNNEIGYQELDLSIGQIIYHWADVGIYGERVTNVLFKHLKVYGLEVAGYFKDSDSNQFKCNYWYPPFYNTYPSFVLDMDSTDNYGCENNGNLNIINTQNTFEPQCPPGECAPEYHVCVEGYVCLNETHSAYQYSNCTISNIQFCTYGCNYLTGKCKSYLGEYCGNGICDPNENEYTCPQDCGAPYVQPNVTPTPTPPPPTPPKYNLTQPLAGINVTLLEQSGYGWVVPFLTPAFIVVVVIVGVGAVVEYYIRSGGVGFSLTVMFLSLILWYLGFFPASVAILITVLCGLFLWYLFSRMGGG